MAFAFDTLAFAKRLRGGGVPDTQADVHAEAAREFIMAELATKSDLEAVRRELNTSIQSGRKDWEASIASVREEIRTLRREVMAKFEHTEARMTVRLGSMIVVATGILAALIKL